MKMLFILTVGELATFLFGQPQSSQGIVAYVREGREIRLVAPDGTNDRLLWEHPLKRKTPAIDGIQGLAWHPGGELLAFSSDHESAYSYYASDLYAIGLKGTPPHRLTNTPDRAELAKFPKGQVTVTLENRQLRSSGAPYSGMFFVFVSGAKEPQMVVLAPGGTKTVVFDVAKITDGPQPVIAIGGLPRWPGAAVRVQPGQNINVRLTVSNYGLRSFGAYGPAWSSDGARVAFGMGLCSGLYSVSAIPEPGIGLGKALAGTGKDRPACVYDWAPAGVSGPPILFAPWIAGQGGADNSIYQTDAEGVRLTRLLHFDSQSERIAGIQWLPDGSGFLFSRRDSPGGVISSTNLYRYDFRTRAIAPVTRLQELHVRSFAVSPDGSRVVYERGKLIYFPSDTDRPALWLIRIDGSQERPFVANGSSPAWGRTSGSHSTPAQTTNTPPPAGSEPSPAPNFPTGSTGTASAAKHGDYDAARGVAKQVLLSDPGSKEALFAVASRAYGTADFDLFERTAPAAVRNGAGISFNLLHHHTLTGGHPATLGIRKSGIIFDPMSSKDCNQRAFEEPLANIVSASQTATAGGEVFLTLKIRDSQGKARTLNFADPGSTVDKSGGFPVLREPADAARRLQALANVIAAAARSSTLDMKK